MTLRSLTTLLFILAFCVLAAGPQAAHAQKTSKVTSDLEQLYEDYQAGKTITQSPSKSAAISATPIYHVRNGRVLIDAVASSSRSQMQSGLAGLGLIETGAYGKMTSGWLPIEKIGELKDVPGLQFARSSAMMTSVGTVTSQGDVSMRTDEVRSVFGLDGTGFTVGILSDTFDDFGGMPLTTYADDIASGDLPAGVNILDDTGGPGIDEGRAMAQLIYDAAPGVGLAFHTAFAGQAAFAQGISDLAAAGADVIVDDIIYFAEPMFQDGIIAQAADMVAASGVPYFSSAGNNAQQSYESGFRPGSALGFNAIPDCGIGTGPPPIFPGTAHDFDPSAGVDIFQEFTINPGEGVGEPFVLQWDEPFFSVSGGAGATSDYDMYLVLTDPGATGLTAPCILLGSAFANVGGDPVEIMGGIFLNSTATSPIEVGILIVEFAATSSAGLLKYVSFGGNAPDEYDTQSATSYGHANAAGAEAVGAADYRDTPEFGTSPPVVESFSSLGGVPILFDISGNRLSTPQVRQKPGITAPDGTNTTFFGFDADSDGFPNFFGTSAAAPHAAAAAALLLQADPSLTPQGVYDALRDNAIDMDDPALGGFQTGFDFRTGYGLIDAFAAVDAAKGGIECTATTLTESAPYIGTDGFGRVDLLFTTPDGIVEIDFSMLNNLEVETSNPVPVSITTGGDGLPTYTFSPAVSPIAMTLKQVDDTNDEAGYFGIAGSPCASADDGVLRVEFDPPVGFASTLADAFDFAGGYPNPSSGPTTIEFVVPEQMDVTLSIYDVMGRKVATLLQRDVAAGQHEIQWDGRSESGARLASGLYLMRLQAGNRIATRRLTIVR